MGDFDGDGDLDFVAGDSLLINVGAGVFEAARAIYPTNVPFAIARGDFNADGRMDLAVAGTALTGPAPGPSVNVFLRDASGSLVRSSGIGFFNGTGLSSLVVADLNKDGRADVAVAASVSTPFSFVVSVSLSNGDGTFASPSIVNIGSQSSDMTSGDFNNDGNPDLAVVGLHGSVIVLLGNGAGGFTLTFAPSVGSFAHVAAADLNNDGKADLIVTDFLGQSVWTLMGDGAGSFSNPRSFPVGGSAVAVAVADLNADGKMDLAVANQAPNGNATIDGSVSILVGDGTGAFATAVNSPVGVQPAAVVIADLDGDGKLDLAVTNTGSSTISVLSGDGLAGFHSPVSFNIWGNPGELVVDDFDADGRPDLAVTLMSSRSVGLLLGKPRLDQPCVFVDDVTVTEGDAGTSPAEVPVRLSQPSAEIVKVAYLIKPSSATAGQDFIGGGGSVTFQPGETSKTISVPIIGDTTDEDDESFFLNLSSAVNARLSDGTARINITDNDPPPTISINDVSAAEGNSVFNSNLATFTVSLSAPSGKTVAVDYTTANGSAIAGDDFDATQGRLFFGAGVTTQTVTVSFRGDLTHEPDETLFVNLSNPSNGTIADSQGQGTILNDDPVPAITIFDGSASEGVGVDAVMTVVVRLSNPSSASVSVDFAFADDTATRGTDYVVSPGTLTFNPGEIQKNITITVKDDTVDEINETFFINLSSPVNATISDGQALCTIFDNDGPTVSINDVNVQEGNSGSTNATFTLTLSAASPQQILLSLATADGTATANLDYTRVTSRTISIPAGSTSVTTNISVIGDVAIEPNETFFVNLSQPQNCTIADGQGVGTILNDDVTSAQFSTDALTVNEADGSVSVTVLHVGDISQPFTAFYSTFDGSASQKSDYGAAFGTLQFSAGEASKTITIFITDDSLAEGSEMFFVSLSGPNGARVGAPSSVAITINASDPGGGPNPLDGASFFVRQHYRDFLNRDPDQSGLDFWTGQITACGSDAACLEVRRINVSAAFFLSIEFQETGYLVERIYKASFGDANGTSTLGGTHQLGVPIVRFNEFILDTQRIGRGVVVLQPGWEQALESNKQAYSQEFVQSPRFISVFPVTLTPTQFVDKLNQNAGNVLSPDERTTAINLFLGAADSNNSTGRAQALRQVAEDADLFRAETNRAFVLTQYFGYLRRNPNDPQDLDYTGYEFWLNKLNQFNGNFVNAEMVKAFTTSGEYRQRFGP